MSRHELSAHDGYSVVVGWDPPLCTFFAQVWDQHKPEDDDEVLWIGFTPGEIRDAKQVVDAVRPWAKIPAGLVDKLTADAEAVDADR